VPARTPTVVLVHGAAAGAWIWEAVACELRARGITHTALDLPTVGEGADPTADVHTDAAFVRGVLDGLEAPVVLCGNSYGGAVITEASAGHPAVARLVYVAAFMPDHDEDLLSFMTDNSAPEYLGAVALRPDGLVEFDRTLVIERSFSQAPPEIAAAAAARARPMAMAMPSPPTVTGVGWRDVSSTYVVCSEDRSIRPASQRRWAQERATDRVELAFDHCPQLSHPVEIAAVLAQVAASTP
jgi:pimeloyl-ACP methyl ester carboxylesterase